MHNSWPNVGYLSNVYETRAKNPLGFCIATRKGKTRGTVRVRGSSSNCILTFAASIPLFASNTPLEVCLNLCQKLENNYTSRLQNGNYQFDTHLDMEIFVSTFPWTALRWRPSLPIKRPMSELCAKIFKGSSASSHVPSALIRCRISTDISVASYYSRYRQHQWGDKNYFRDKHNK